MRNVIIENVSRVKLIFYLFKYICGWDRVELFVIYGLFYGVCYSF